MWKVIINWLFPVNLIDLQIIHKQKKFFRTDILSETGT